MYNTHHSDCRDTDLHKHVPVYISLCLTQTHTTREDSVTCTTITTHHFPVITTATSNPISIRCMCQKVVYVCSFLFFFACVRLFGVYVQVLQSCVCVSKCLKTKIACMWVCMLQGNLVVGNVCVGTLWACVCVHMWMCPVLNSLSAPLSAESAQIYLLSPACPLLLLGNGSTNTHWHAESHIRTCTNTLFSRCWTESETECHKSKYT